MRRGRTRSEITGKEEEILQLLWQNGPMFVKQMVELFPDPKPHFNTISTFVRGLERKEYVEHVDVNGTYQYSAVAKMEDIRRKTFGNFIKNYFNNSYLGAVSSLIEDEKISPEELRELIELVQKKNS